MPFKIESLPYLERMESNASGAVSAVILRKNALAELANIGVGEKDISAVLKTIGPFDSIKNPTDAMQS